MAVASPFRRVYASREPVNPLSESQWILRESAAFLQEFKPNTSDDKGLRQSSDYAGLIGHLDHRACSNRLSIDVISLLNDRSHTDL